jgi:hypothetical protein
MNFDLDSMVMPPPGPFNKQQKGGGLAILCQISLSIKFPYVPLQVLMRSRSPRQFPELWDSVAKSLSAKPGYDTALAGSHLWPVIFGRQSSLASHLWPVIFGQYRFGQYRFGQSSLANTALASHLWPVIFGQYRFGQSTLASRLWPGSLLETVRIPV